MNKVLKNVGILAIFGLVAFVATDVLAQGTSVGGLKTEVERVLESIRSLCYIAAAISIFWQGANIIFSEGTAVNWGPIKGVAYGLILVYAASWAASGLLAVFGK